MLFEDRVAVITGAAQGIGRAIARRLADEGVSVALGDVDGHKLKETADLIGAGDRTTIVEADLSNRAGADDLMAAALSAFGRVDILVNNAGGGVILPTLQHSEETLRTTIDRNLWTTVHATLAVLPHMVERGYGRIVNLGAESVRNGLYWHAIYNAAKGGVHGLTTGLAREFAPRGITVNTVAPSITLTEQVAPLLRLVEVAAQGPEAVEREAQADTAFAAAAAQFGPLLERGLGEFYTKTVDMIPVGRPASVEEVASMVAYLASDEAGFVTGQIISVNGGSSMS